MATDEITLTLPRGPEYQRVAHLVLGGLAVRLDLTIENLEDLELALDALLDAIDRDAGDSELDVRRLLESTVDDVHVDGDWVRLTKKVGTNVG